MLVAQTAEVSARRRLSVAIVSSDPLARAGLSALLSLDPTLWVVTESSLEEDLEAVLMKLRPDTAVWDLGTDARPWLERLREFRGSDIPILLLVAQHVEALELLAGGARGVLYRDADSQKVSAALHAIAEKMVVIDEGFALRNLRNRDARHVPFRETLTSRELEALQLLAQGLSNKEIGARLGISEHTAKFHVNSILGKLDVQSRTEAVIRAARLGLILL